MESDSNLLIKTSSKGGQPSMEKSRMKRVGGILSIFLLLFGIIAAMPANADTLYDNSTSNSFSGTVGGWTVGNFGDQSFSVANSFNLSSAATLTGVNFGAWLFGSDSSILSIDWVISTAPFGGSILGSGTASIDQVNQKGTAWDWFPMQLDSFSLPSLSLDGGTYWLVLANAVTTTGDPIFWDESDGASSAQSNDGSSNPSETFSIDGSYAGPVGAQASEPGSLLLFGTGLMAMAFFMRKKLIA
jgi:hypothetical protein